MTIDVPLLKLPEIPPTTVFISHSSKDEAVVRWLEAQVKAAGHKPWIAEWDPRPGARLTDKVLGELRGSDAYVLLLTEEGYDSVYVQQESGAAVASGKPVIALVDKDLGPRPLGMLNDIEQVRFDRDNLAESTAAITTGLVQLGKSRGVVVAPDTIVMPTQPAMFQMSVEMKLQFQVTPNQVLIGVGALLVIGGLLYLATKEAGPLGA
jgi:hypothetical protein